MQLEANGARFNLLSDGFRLTDIALAEEADIHRKCVGRPQHLAHVKDTWRHRRGAGARCRPGATAEHRGDATGQRFFNLLRTDEVDVRVNATRGNDHAFAGDHFGGRTNRHGHVGLHVRIAALADPPYAAIFETDVGLDDAEPSVDDQRVGDDGVCHFRRGQLRLAHAVANNFSAAKFNFFAVSGEITFDFNKQIGVSETNAVAGGWAVHLGIRST